MDNLPILLLLGDYPCFGLFYLYTKSYKKCDNNTYNEINREAKQIATNLGIQDRTILSSPRNKPLSP